VKRVIFCFIAVAAIAALLLTSGQSFAGKTLFDDFSSKYIDASKWRQRTYVRETVNGQFVSSLGNRSPYMSAEITPGIFRNNLRFQNPDLINLVECDLTIVETTLDSAPNSSSFGRVGGYFYNINPAGGATGDIFVHVAIGDRGNGGLEAYWDVFEVLSDDTKTDRRIAHGTLIGVGTLQTDVAYNVKISYDGGHTFSFYAYDQEQIDVALTDYNTVYSTDYSRERGPVTSFKALSTGINATNGSNNGFVSAKFDNVKKNNETTVHDDFSTSPLDLSKWRDVEWVKKISSGSLHAYIQNVDQRSQVNTYLTEIDSPYIEAKARIKSDSQLSSGANGIARIQGHFYNDIRGPGSGQPYNGYEGNVFAEVRLQYYSDGSLRARAIVSRKDDADQTSSTDLLNADFTPPSLDTDYTISIRYTGSQLILKCNDEEFTHNISTAAYKPYGEHRCLRTRIYLDPGESGYMKALFDDVYIEKKGEMMPAIPLLLLGD